MPQTCQETYDSKSFWTVKGIVQNTKEVILKMLNNVGPH